MMKFNSMLMFMLAMILASLRLPSTAALTRHVVGDSLGWTIPAGGAATYNAWASKRTFKVGDTLLFNFTSGIHNVAEVSQAAYGPCSAANTLSLNPNGPAVMKLTRPGNHYYICTVVSHCQIGQKLAIKVSPAATSTDVITPSSTVAAAPSPFGFSPIGSPFPPPTTSSASSLAAVVPAVTFLAVGLGLFY